MPAAALLGVALACAAPAQAKPFTVLYAFTGAQDGSMPQIALGPQGTLLGVGKYGGLTDKNAQTTFGTAFTMTASGSLTTLHAFKGAPDGNNPVAVAADAAGNLFGAAYGGPNGCISGGCGELFKIAAGSVVVTRLHAFVGGSIDGAVPQSLTLDPSGNIYGATAFGGSEGCNDRYGCGTIFSLSAAGKYHLLHRFTNGADGSFPTGQLAVDSAGNVYGSDATGGTGYGVTFRISPAGLLTVLHSFALGTDGGQPGGVVLDGSGNLYGSAYLGGAGSSGVIYKIDAGGNFSVLYSFKGGADGAGPTGAMAIDGAGNLFGTAAYGGQSLNFSGCADNAGISTLGCGVVFEISPAGKETVLHQFTGLGDGGAPNGLVRAANGQLFGATRVGGPLPFNGLAGSGTIYQVTP